MTPFSRIMSATVSRGGAAMYDHVGLNVRDYEASKKFYDPVLATLGYGLVLEFPHACGYGPEGKPEFWIVQREPPGTGTHVAFASPDRATVDAFHDAAVAAGGKDNGAPGLRPDYHEHYYGAFVLDPDGNNVEAVCHRAD
jgi:catechol 2,3-dioxygenase-like lactoylglutathione lyase family enzyme